MLLVPAVGDSRNSPRRVGVARRVIPRATDRTDARSRSKPFITLTLRNPHFFLDVLALLSHARVVLEQGVKLSS